MKLQKIVNNKTIIVSFDYQESAHNVYKHFSVTINGKNSNSRGLSKFITAELPDICKANTYFWHAAGAASMRRSNENRSLNEVENFFISQGFEKLS